MPKFVATVVTGEGRRRWRTLEARTESEARESLRSAGFFVERVVIRGQGRSPGRRTKIARKQVVYLFEQLQMLLSAGVLIPDALSKLKDRFPDRQVRGVLQVIHAHVVQSRSNLSNALSLFPRSFPPGIVSVIAAGEEAGTTVLSERFGDLAERIAFEDGNRRQVMKACAYPALIVVMATSLYFFLLGVVFPRLTELLTSIGGGLPPLTRAVIGVSAVVRRDWVPLIAIGLGLPIAFWALRRIPKVGLLFDRAFLHLPLVGVIYRNLTVALVCKVYRSLYQANRNAPDIIDGCIGVVGNRAFAQGLRGVRERISTGRSSLSHAFEESRIFPGIACVVVELGEDTGKLPEALERVAQHFDREAKERIASLIAVINPIMTLVVVGGVGVIMLSFFQAVYQVIYVVH